MQEIKIGGKIAASNEYELWGQLCGWARGYGNPDTAKGRAWHKFKDFTGHEPPKSLPWFDDMPSLPITEATRNKITQLNIRFAKSRRYAR